MRPFFKKHRKALIILAILFVIFGIIIGLVVWAVSQKAPPALVLTIGHIGELRGRFRDVRLVENNKVCFRMRRTGCVGGFARVATKVKQLREESTDFLLLNAGNTFAGSNLYISFKWNISAALLKLLDFDAYVLGIREFDDRIANMVNFIYALAPKPVVVCNIDDSMEPRMKGITLKSAIFLRGGKRIGVIGVISTEVMILSSPGKIKVTDEITAVNEEADRLVTEEKVFTIIVLSSRGFHEDAAMAELVNKEISIIVGGSETLLYNGDVLSNDETEGYYPIVLTQETGHKVLIVQASQYSKYLGNITIFYNEKGKAIQWEGNPIFLDTDVEEDPEMVKEIDKWHTDMLKKRSEVVGEASMDIDNNRCLVEECAIGDFLADAMVDGWQNYEDKEENAWTYVSLAIFNSAAIVRGLKKGSITNEKILHIQPFQNSFDCAVFLGSHIIEILDQTLHPYSTPKMTSELNLFQQAGFKLRYYCGNTSCDLQRIQVRCQNCTTPKYEKINDYLSYRMVVPSLLLDGTDADTLKLIQKYASSYKRGPTGVDFLRNYIRELSPIKKIKDNRTLVFGRVPKYTEK